MQSVVSPHTSSRAPRRWARRVLASVTVFSATSIVLLSVAPAAPSQQESAVTSVRERLERAQADASAVQHRYERAVVERDQSQVQIDTLEQTIASTRAEEAAVRSETARRAVALYKHSDVSGLRILDTEELMEPGRKRKFTESADEFYEKRAQELRAEADRQQQSHDDLQRRRAELVDAVPRLEREKAEAEQKVARAQRGIEIAEQLAPLRGAGEPLMGPSVLNATEMAGWLRTTGSAPRLSGGVTLELIAQMFVDEGTAENVRGDVAFAQAYIETGGFSAGGSDNNFSGLGACDGCRGQNRFPTALDGIRAQMQLLKAYAGGGPLVNPASPYWWTGDAAGAYASFGGTGDAPTWRQMGGGNWATDGAYSSKVLGTYDKMIASAGGS
jgi:Mannosyl-glycoprotein endo-beta-N-acetylglucosaminidase